MGIWLLLVDKVGQKLRYFTDQNEPKLGLHKGKFLTIFKFRNEFYNQTEQKK